MAETPDREVPLCNEHFESLIEIAEKRHAVFPPGFVRSCMERASYRIATSPRGRGRS